MNLAMRLNYGRWLHCISISPLVEAGFPKLKTIAKLWLQQYLKNMDIKPFKIKYYLEKKAPGFEEKMHELLLVYKQVEMQFDENGGIIIPEDGHMTHTPSYDEKLGIQAVANKYLNHNPTLEISLQ